ncbi:MAG: DnaB-like helicase N-terminal domain-containing protein [Bacteroidota bacterium]
MSSDNYHIFNEKRITIEKAIIGSILNETGAYFVARDFLSNGNFSVNLCRHVFETCQTVIDHGLMINLITVGQKIKFTSYLEYSNFNYRLVEMSGRMTNGVSLPLECLLLVEMGIRDYLNQQLTKFQPKINPFLMEDFKAYQNMILDCTTDIFVVLETGKEYFRNTDQGVTKRIENCSHLIDQKATTIKARSGKKILEYTVNHYNKYYPQTSECTAE